MGTKRNLVFSRDVRASSCRFRLSRPQRRPKPISTKDSLEPGIPCRGSLRAKEWPCLHTYDAGGPALAYVQSHAGLHSTGVAA
jgi:hypothetical protein